MQGLLDEHYTASKAYNYTDRDGRPDSAFSWPRLTEKDKAEYESEACAWYYKMTTEPLQTCSASVLAAVPQPGASSSVRRAECMLRVSLRKTPDMAPHHLTCTAY